MSIILCIVYFDIKYMNKLYKYIEFYFSILFDKRLKNKIMYLTYCNTYNRKVHGKKPITHTPKYYQNIRHNKPTNQIIILL